MQKAAMKFGGVLKTEVHYSPNHPGDIPEGTMRAILKQAGIEPDDFLRDQS
jgi:hypothetical protein